MDPTKRSPDQQRKLRLAFLATGASREIREARLRLAGARLARDRYSEKIPTVMVMREGDKRQAHVLNRGAYDAPGEAVEAGLPAEIASAANGFSDNRLGLARWLVDRSNPLTARVIVNRYWQLLFGTGLVKTSEDFGSQGERPSHPKLLDWLAVEFMESGWDVKHILRTIVTSSAYRRDSRATAEMMERDPENRLLARGPRFRLAAEMVRDQALFASGLLSSEIGGPPVKPYQPPGLWEEVSGARYERDQGEKLYRRSLYTYWKRTVAPPSMVGFDAPDRESCNVRRPRTNTPLQALTLMNDVTYVEAARKMAERMIREGGDDVRSRLDRGVRLALARSASGFELDTLQKALSGFERHFENSPHEAAEFLEQGESDHDPSIEPAELAAYANAASLILNLDEAVTKQ